MKYKLITKYIKHIKLNSIFSNDIRFFDTLEDKSCIVFITKKELSDNDKSAVIGALKGKNIANLDLRIHFTTKENETYQDVIENSYILNFEDFLKK